MIVKWEASSGLLARPLSRKHIDITRKSSGISRRLYIQKARRLGHYMNKW